VELLVSVKFTCVFFRFE